MKVKIIAGASVLLCVALLAVWALTHNIAVGEQAQAQQPSVAKATDPYSARASNLASQPDSMMADDQASESLLAVEPVTVGTGYGSHTDDEPRSEDQSARNPTTEKISLQATADPQEAGRTTQGSSVYPAPDHEAQVLGFLEPGQLVAISSQNGEWYEIVYLDGPGGHGWISQADLSFNVAWRASEPKITAVSLSKEKPPADVEVETASVPNNSLEKSSPQAAPSSTTPIGTGDQTETGESVLEETFGPSGTLVFQTSSGGAIYLLDLDNKELRYLADGLDPALSPDGSQVAFTRWDNPRGLYVMDVDGSQQRQLVGENLIKNPTWSPDGQRLIYNQQQGGSEARTFMVPRFGEISIPADPHWRLEVIDANGNNLEGVPDQPHSFNPSWSEQGVLYAENGTIYISEPAGETWAFYSGSNEVRNPVWSPDGRYVIATMEFHDHWEIVRLDADGNNLLRLTANYDRVHSVAPTWSPDGETIAYLSDQDGSWALWVMDVDGGRQQLLVPDLLAGIDFQYDFMAEHVVDWN